MTDMSCEDFQRQSAELALRTLDGRQRAEALAHVEHCPNCRQDLLLLSDVADRLVELTPAAEPPAGFETRVLAALSAAGQSSAPEATGPTAPRPRPAGSVGVVDRGRPGRRLVMTLSAAALAVILGLGAWLVGRQTAPRAHPASQAITASLVTGGHRVGQVVAVPGDFPWISMAVDISLGNQTVRCQLVEGGRSAVTIGSFTLANGYGYWSAPIPASASPITGARLVDAAGHTVATATFSQSL